MARILQTLYGVPSRSVEELGEVVRTYEPNVADYPDDEWGMITLELAYEAVLLGNFGIGCVLVDPAGNMVASGHNEVFVPYFRSDRHGEMVVMDAFEEDNKSVTSMAGYTLYTSLESCPMCLARLITSGVATVKYLAPDAKGGMVHLMGNLPQIWQELAKRQTFPQANCSPLLIQAAFEIFMINADQLNTQIVNR
jgi:tRNA(Arg) A34 adenosine deaminase TadA